MKFRTQEKGRWVLGGSTYSETYVHKPNKNRKNNSLYGSLNKSTTKLIDYKK